MTDAVRKPAIFCITTYEKGQPFLREAARLGFDVMLLTLEKHRHGDWPFDCIRHFFTMPADLTSQQILNTVMYFARTHHIDRLVALDEFDQETGAMLREHMRLPGMSLTEARFFRDKLAMRTAAREAGIPVPNFTGVFHHDDVAAFMDANPGPWLLKPRSNASAIGIRPIEVAHELWPVLDQLGDLQSHYVLECFVPGDVYHVEGVTWNGELLYSQPCKYGKPPIQTMHQGGVFSTRTLPATDPEAQAITAMQRRVLAALHLRTGVTHTEFIRAHHDGQFYFLESAARVGGAFIADVVEWATGVNPWIEWARLEYAQFTGNHYSLPTLKQDAAGSVICLARQSDPDLSGFTDPEIAVRLHKHHHAGILVHAATPDRVQQLVESYADRFLQEFCAVVPPPERPTA